MKLPFLGRPGAGLVSLVEDQAGFIGQVCCPIVRFSYGYSYCYYVVSLLCVVAVVVYDVLVLSPTVVVLTLEGVCDVFVLYL